MFTCKGEQTLKGKNEPNTYTKFSSDRAVSTLCWLQQLVS